MVELPVSVLVDDESKRVIADMKILVACEFSGVVRRAFAARGHDVWSCDLLPAEDRSNRHIIGDVRAIVHDGWDMMIAHPPCTRLCNSGVAWLHKRNLWTELDAGAELFSVLWNAPIPMRCVENPVMHKYAKARIRNYRDPQYVQPWQFGHGETKQTGLWLHNLPDLVPTDIVEGREQRVFKMSPSTARWQERSRTFPGIAAAMAEQWPNLWFAGWITGFRGDMC